MQLQYLGPWKVVPSRNGSWCTTVYCMVFYFLQPYLHVMFHESHSGNVKKRQNCSNPYFFCCRMIVPKKNQNTPYLELLYITLQLQQKNRLEKQQQFLCKLILPAALTYWNSATNINADILKHVIITVNYAILCSLRLPWSKWAERTVCLKKQAYFLQWKQ